MHVPMQLILSGRKGSKEERSNLIPQSVCNPQNGARTERHVDRMWYVHTDETAVHVFTDIERLSH